MKKISKIFLFIVSMFMLTNSVSAEEVSEVNNTDKHSFNYLSKNTVDFNDEVDASSVVFGDKVNFGGVIKGVNLLFGNNVTYTGTSSYMALFGNNVKVSGNLLNDGVVFGNYVVFDSNAVVNRDIVIFGNNVVLSGTFNRDVRVYASSLSLDGVSILGNVYVSANNVKLDKESSVDGYFKYNEDTNLTNDNNNLKLESYKVEVEKQDIWDVVKRYIGSFLSYVFILAVMLIIYPKLFNKLNKNTLDVNTVLKRMGVGLGVLVLVPICILILIFSSLGGYVGVVIGLIYTLLIMISGLITSYTIGRIISNKLMKKEISNYLVGIIGIVCVSIILLIPVVGGIFGFLSLIYGIGQLIVMFKNVRN